MMNASMRRAPWILGRVSYALAIRALPCEIGVREDLPIGGPILDNVIDNEDGSEEGDDFEAVEGEGHVVDPHAPGDEDHERDDHEGCLHAFLDGEGEAEIHLILVGGLEHRRVVAQQGQDDETDECCRQSCLV